MIMYSGRSNDAGKTPCRDTSEEHSHCCCVSLLKRKYVPDLKLDEKDYLGCLQWSLKNGFREKCN